MFEIPEKKIFGLQKPEELLITKDNTNTGLLAELRDIKLLLQKFYENSGKKESSEQLLTLADVCNLLKVKETFVRDLVFRRKIPFIKVSKFLRFKKSEIENWLNGFSSAGRRK